MDLAKYKKIYKEQVLPKKSVSKNSPESAKDTIKLLKELSIYRERANRKVLGENDYGKE